MIPYNLSSIRAFVFDVDGVLSPNIVMVDSDGNPARMANVKDGYAIQLAVKHGYKIAIISGADSEQVRKRYSLLGVTDIYLRAGSKLPVLEQWMTDNGLTAEEVAYVGDDIPDIPCMERVGLSIAPADAASDVKEIAKYISPLTGGAGVAREVIEQTMRARGEWLHSNTAYGW